MTAPLRSAPETCSTWNSDSHPTPFHVKRMHVTWMLVTWTLATWSQATLIHVKRPCT